MNEWHRGSPRDPGAPRLLGSLVVGLVLLIRGSSPLWPADAAQAEGDCEQPSAGGCPLVLGQAASAALSGPTEVHTWLLHLETGGALSVLLTQLNAESGVHVFRGDGSLVGEATGAASALVSVPAARPGDYQVYVSSTSGAVSDQPYLLLATLQPEAALAPSSVAVPMAPASPAPEGAAPAASLVAGVPAAPSGLTATPLPSTQIQLVWVDNSDNEKGFRITDDLALPVTVEANVSLYVTPPLGSGRTGCYRVQAYNDFGTSAWVGPVCATVRTLPQPQQPPSLPVEVLRPLPPPPVPPSPPGGLRASPVNWNTIRLDWTDTSGNETGFAIDGDGGFFTVRAGTTTANVGGLAPSTTYCFTVSAFNEVGQAASNEACATTLPRPPGP